MLSKKGESPFFKHKNKFKIISSAKIINPKKLKNRRSQAKFPRTSSAINLPRIQFDPNDSIQSHNSTAFSFKNLYVSNPNRNNNDKTNKSLNQLLNINSIEDFIGKNKDPLEKQKQLYEEMKEEKMKIKNVLSNLISWDNEIESLEIIKNKNGKREIAKLRINSNKKLASSKTMDNIYSDNISESDFNKSKKVVKLKENENNKIIIDGLKMIRGKMPMQFLREMNISKGTQIKEKKMKLTQLKFSVFDKDYDPKKYNTIIQKEKDTKKEEDEKINKFNEKNNLAQFQKDQRRIEITHREEIATIYKNIIINKIKKKKFTEVLDETYKLLDKARTEYSLSVDILKERIKAVQKYYNAYIIAVDKTNDNKKGYSHKNQTSNSGDNESEHSKRNKGKMTGMDIYEEKIKRYREYLLIMEDLNKEIKNYDDKFGLIQDELNSLLKISSERISQLTISSRQLKYIFKELNSQQTQYYLNLLKKGNDTRTEGLSWIVQRLMELNIQIDSSMFPGFLDQEQIDYIIQISKLSYESVQLKQILESLRGSQNNIKLKKRPFLGYEDKEIQKYEEKIKEIQFFNSDINNLDELLKDYDHCKTFKTLDKLKSVVHLEQNTSDFKNKVLQNFLEDIFIKSIIKNIKSKLIVNENNQITIQRQNTKNSNLINYLLAKDKNKDYYKDVIILCERIQRLNDFIKKMRREEFLIFEEKFKYGIKSEKTKKFYDKVFNALFGSSTFEFSDFQKINLYDE